MGSVKRPIQLMLVIREISQKVSDILLSVLGPQVQNKWTCSTRTGHLPQKQYTYHTRPFPIGSLWPAAPIRSGCCIDISLAARRQTYIFNDVGLGDMRFCQTLLNGLEGLVIGIQNIYLAI